MKKIKNPKFNYWIAIIFSIFTLPQILRAFPDSDKSTKIWTSSSIQLSSANNLGDFLKEYAGINLIAKGEMGQKRQINMRGANSNNVLILLNEQAISSTWYNQEDLNHIPLEFIEKIEIISNPDPVLYGINCSGGIIKISLKKHSGDEPFSRLEANWGDYNLRTYNFNYGNSSYNIDYFFGIILRGIRPKTPNNNYLGQNIMANVLYKFDSSFKIKLDLHVYSDESAYNEKLDSTIILFSNKSKNDENYQRIEFNKSTRDNSIFSFSLTKQYFFNKFDNVLTYNNYFRQNLKLTYDKMWNKNFKTFLGSEMDEYSFLGIRESLNNVESRIINTNRSYFLQTQFFTEKKINFALGYRFIAPEKYSNNSMPNLNFNYIFTNNIDTDIYLSRNYSYPDFNDIYGDNFIQNPSGSTLIPEKADIYGMDFNLNSEDIPISIKLKLFQTNFSSYLMKQTENNKNNISTTNLNEAFSKNVEIYLDGKFLKYSTGEIGYAYIDAHEKNSDRYLPYQPDEKLTYYLTFDKNFRKDDLNLKIKFGGEKVGTQYSNIDNNTELSPYTLLNTKIILQIIDVSFYFCINNIQNTHYETLKGYTMPERRFFFGFDWQFWD